MKKIFTLLFFSSLLTGTLLAQNARYIDEVFSDAVKILQSQPYSVNITVITGAPALDTLLFDLYAPLGDTCTNRPLAIVLHTGTFLPRGFLAPTGDKDDYANRQICERLAKRGYVAASVQYRVGWNPIASEDTVRRSTIINAAYRSIQDLFAFIRFAHLSVEDLGNPYKIDTSRIAVFGIGTGGFVGFNAAVLQQEEIYIDKFTNPSGKSMIDTNLVGDLHGIKPAAINIPNHVGYNDDFQFAFGLDGAVGDSSWMEDELSVPLVAAGTVTHPTTPYCINAITGEIDCECPVFAAGQYVVDIAGSACMISKANSFGINNPLLKGVYDDPVSEEIRSNPNVFGQEHLWGINLPGPQTGPWEFWDSTFWKMVPSPYPGLSINDLGLVTNPDMSQQKADRYIDTALWFFSPRAFVALKLNDLVCSCEGVVPDPSIHLITDFECQRNFTFGAGNDRLMIMENPDPDINDHSEKIGAYSDPTHDPFAALCAVALDSFDLSLYNVFKVDVNGPAIGVPFLLKIEGGNTPPSGHEVWVNTTASDSWETLTADFSDFGCDKPTKVCIFPNGGVDSPDEATYLLDNLRFEESGDTCLVIGLFYPDIPTLEISPNPVSDMLYIRNPENVKLFTVVNILGQHLMELKNNNPDIARMDLSKLEPGIYMIGAYDSQGKLVGNARIMKN